MLATDGVGQNTEDVTTRMSISCAAMPTRQQQQIGSSADDEQW